MIKNVSWRLGFGWYIFDLIARDACCGRSSQCARRQCQVHRKVVIDQRSSNNGFKVIFSHMRFSFPGRSLLSEMAWLSKDGGVKYVKLSYHTHAWLFRYAEPEGRLPYAWLFKTYTHRIEGVSVSKLLLPCLFSLQCSLIGWHWCDVPALPQWQHCEVKSQAQKRLQAAWGFWGWP